MKVNGPLHSFQASGKMGGIVFSKDGTARMHTAPANPQTPGQQNQRQKMAAGGSFVKRMTATSTRSAIKSSAIVGSKPAKYWVALFVTAYSAQLATARPAFVALPQAEQDSWETQGTTFGLLTISLPNTTDGDISPGLQLFTAANALFINAVFSASSLPDGSNAAAWYNSIVGL